MTKTWQKETARIAEETLSQLSDNVSIRKTERVQIKVEKKKKKRATKPKTEKKTIQKVTNKLKREAPTIIVNYKDSNGKDISTEYICHSITIGESRQTSLVGMESTKREDVIDITIEAAVVEIN